MLMDDRIPGRREGKVVRKKAFTGPAPSTIACSSSPVPTALVTSVMMVIQ